MSGNLWTFASSALATTGYVVRRQLTTEWTLRYYISSAARLTCHMGRVRVLWTIVRFLRPFSAVFSQLWAPASGFICDNDIFYLTTTMNSSIFYSKFRFLWLSWIIQDRSAIFSSFSFVNCLMKSLMVTTTAFPLAYLMDIMWLPMAILMFCDPLLFWKLKRGVVGEKSFWSVSEILFTWSPPPEFINKTFWGAAFASDILSIHDTDSSSANSTNKGNHIVINYHLSVPEAFSI